MDDFGRGDLDLATTYYQRVTDPTARAILDFLIDHPDQQFDGAAIVRQLNLARHRDVARAMFTMGEMAGALGRKRPWHEAQLGYTMRAEPAALLRRAREHTVSECGSVG